MSILIKGLDMPKDDSELLCIEIRPNGRVSIDLDLCCEPIATAVEVPTPHGRLIDADSLIAKHEKAAHSHGGASYSFHMAARAWVMATHTIIEAEEGE